MLGHGFALPEIERNLVLVKDGFELELISIHIPQEDSNIFVTSALIQVLTNGAGYSLKFFLLMVTGPNLYCFSVLIRQLTFYLCKVITCFQDPRHTTKGILFSLTDIAWRDLVGPSQV